MSQVLLNSKGEDFDTAKKILSYVLELAKFDLNYDVRDRARVLRKLLSCYFTSSEIEEKEKADNNEIEIPVLLAEHVFGENVKPSIETVNNRFYLPGSLSQIVFHAAPGYEPLPEPCSLTESDMVKGLEGPGQTEVNDSDVDSGSLNEEGSYYSEDSVTASTRTDDESATSETGNNNDTTDSLISFADVGKPQEETNDVSELMSKGDLESWLGDNNGQGQSQSHSVDERIPSARISIGDISARIKPNIYTLLDPTYGNGLKVEYKYSSEASTISPSLVSVDTFFQNCSSEPMSKLILTDEDSESVDQGRYVYLSNYLCLSWVHYLYLKCDFFTSVIFCISLVTSSI